MRGRDGRRAEKGREGERRNQVGPGRRQSNIKAAKVPLREHVQLQERMRVKTEDRHADHLRGKPDPSMRDFFPSLIPERGGTDRGIEGGCQRNFRWSEMQEFLT